MSEGIDYKARLLEVLLAQHGNEQRVWSGLSDEHKQATGRLKAWAAKDYIVHVTYWREVYTQRLRAAASGGAVPLPDPDFILTNDAVFEEHKNDSWNEVIDRAKQAQDEFIQSVEAINKSEMEDPEKFEWTNNRPLWQYIAFGEGYHPYAHLSDILSLCGNDQEAEKVQLDLYESLTTLDDSDSWQGTQRYNLACFYALHEHPERALELLHESFALNPALIDWSRQDSDLDPLRELVEFQALYPQEV
ncbi:MAG: ClbS/DfsB family four-helix bundle protein [Anaerolineales bacterium]|jgi:hypothetical protein